MIYLDHLATTPCDPRVVEAMLPYFAREFGNPASPHLMGKVAEDAVILARKLIAELLDVFETEIVFTSGATESNNMAILGIARDQQTRRQGKNRIVTTLIEHKSVLAPIKHLESQGWIVDYLPVDNEGNIAQESLSSIISNETLLVSVQLANSEIGTIQSVGDLAAFAHGQGAIIHCDASQAVGKISVSPLELDIDLLSFSSHKMYGPKGTGALWIKSGFEALLQPQFFGGATNNILRPGTLPVPLIVGFGKAAELCQSNLGQESKGIAQLRDSFENTILKAIPIAHINGNMRRRLPNMTSIVFPMADAEAMLANMPEIFASTGSACESGTPEPSRTLIAIGMSDEDSYSTIRFGLGRYTTHENMSYAAQRIISVYPQVIEKAIV